MAAGVVNVVLAGVGGQGILLASELVAQAARIAGYDVKTNEVHGMAQRGGSVVAQVRFGEKVFSPLVMQGTAHVLGALEALEGLRFADYLAPEGLAVVSTQQILPLTATLGQSPYPDDLQDRLKARFPRLVLVEALEAAEKCGLPRAANVVVLGALSKGLDLPLEAWQKALEISVKPAYLDLNRKAFEAGRALVSA